MICSTIKAAITVRLVKSNATPDYSSKSRNPTYSVTNTTYSQLYAVRKSD